MTLPTNCTIFKRLIAFLVICFAVFASHGQNAIGITAGYGYFQATEWDRMIAHYNSADTVSSKHPYLRHMPVASIFYERKLTEYFYLQGFADYRYATTSSQPDEKLLLTVQGPGLGININWYPCKMITGLKFSPFNPILLQFTLGGNYLTKTLTLGGENVLEKEKKGFNAGNFGFYAGTGLGYDLHFGKRIVVQTTFMFHYFPSMDFPELEYFVPKPAKEGLSTSGSCMIMGGKIGIMYLFKFRKRRSQTDMFN